MTRSKHGSERSTRAALATLSCVVALLSPRVATAVEIHVMISGGFAAAYAELVPIYERATGNQVVTARGPSMGETREAIPNRLARGEAADVLILVDTALDDLIAKGRAVRGSRVDLARSSIAMAVKAGAPTPDISTVDAFTRALSEAKSIAYSDSASGVYLERVLLPRLDVDGRLRAKSRMIPAEPVGAVVARGEAELGFQQRSELQPVAGITIIGLIPAALQQVTVFVAGVSSNATQGAAARDFIAYLASRQAIPAITASGMDAVAAAAAGAVGTSAP